jgi:hypothetical protein
MTSQLSATLSSEQAALAEFLQRTFQSPAQMNSFDPDMLSWKYFSAHPDWPEARSYVGKKDDQIMAHAGIWPLRLMNAGQELRVIHMIDWAAARTEPGVGVLLLRKLAGMCDLLLTIGGSADTRAILPKIGYRKCGVLKLQARVIHPSRQFRLSSNLNWKAPLRMLRNAAWSLPTLPRVPRGWVASNVPRFDDSIASIIEHTTAEDVISQRTVTGLNYFLKCPGAKFSAYLISQSGRLRGYFLLSQIQGQTRIVNLGINTENSQDWPTACALAAQTAANLPKTCEIVAGFSNPSVQAEFAQMGFRVRQVLPVFCYDPRKRFELAHPLDLSMLDGDLCFMANSKNPYLT